MSPSKASKSPLKASKSPSNVSKPPSRARKPPAKARKSPAKVSKPPAKGSKSPEEVSKSPGEVSKSPSRARKPPAKARKSPAKVSKPPAKGSKSPEEVSKSPEEVSKSPGEVSTSPEEASKSPENASTKPRRRFGTFKGARELALWNARANKSEELASYLEDLGFDSDVVDQARPDPRDTQADDSKETSPVEKRITVLKTMFNDELCPPRQKVNILKAIDLYEKGQIKPTDPLMYIQDGEVVELGHYNGGLPMWIEGRAKQLGQSAVYSLTNNNSHMIPMQIRLVPRLSRHDRIVHAKVLNDTGSSIHSILEDDVAALFPDGYLEGYEGWLPNALIETANGIVTRVSLMLEVRLLDGFGQPFTDWISETGLVSREEGASRLSGAAIRDRLYFATAPGNTNLYISTTKVELCRVLPSGPW